MRNGNRESVAGERGKGAKPERPRGCKKGLSREMDVSSSELELQPATLQFVCTTVLFPPIPLLLGYLYNYIDQLLLSETKKTFPAREKIKLVEFLQASSFLALVRYPGWPLG